MNKATLQFDLTDPDQKREFQKVLNISNYEQAIWQIAQNLFRPARKHGYSEMQIDPVAAKKLNELTKDTNVEEAISLLESEFYNIVNNLNVNPNE